MRVTQIQRFSTHDGPGIRTTVFLKGCPLRCKWCHNPETQKPYQEIYFVKRNCIFCRACEKVCSSHAHIFQGEDHTFNVNGCIAKNGCSACTDICPTGAVEPVSREAGREEILKEVMRDTAFYGDNGGVTLSGGEPFFHTEEALALLEMFRNNGLDTAVETCGFFPAEYCSRVAKSADLLLWDIKDTDEARHIENTGVSCEPIIRNLLEVDSFGARTLMRCIIVGGVNDNEEHYAAIARLWKKLKNCVGIELIPYHAYGGSKSEQLGYMNTGDDKMIPSDDTMKAAREAVVRNGGKLV